MLKFTDEKLIDAYEKAKPPIKIILKEMWIANRIELIGKKFNFRIDKIGNLIKIIGYVLLDLVPISKLAIVLETELKIEKIIAEEVAKEIDQYIFSVVREKVTEYIKPELETEKNIKDSQNIKNNLNLEKKNNEENIIENKEIFVDPYREDVK